MNIHCPQCDYERHVDDDKLPASACMATCPKCAYRFQFRENVTPECSTTPAVANCTESACAGSACTGSACVEHQEKPESQTIAKSSASVAPAQEQGMPQAQDEKPVAPKTMWDDLSSTVNRWNSKQSAPAQAQNKPDASPNAQQHTQKTHQQANAESKQAYPADNTIPWENLGVYTFFQGLILTIRYAAMSPAAFFGSMAHQPSLARSPLSRPLTFFVLLGLFQAIMERMWYVTLSNTLSTTIADPQLQTLLEGISHDTNVFITLLISPFMLTLQVFVLTGLYYLMFRFVRPDKADFKLLFRIMCYAAAPTVVCIIPLFGPIVASFIYLVWTFIGCKYALDLPWSRIFMALAPLYLLGVAFILQVVHTLIMSMVG
ncbi:MAG: zinc-ribbon domain-containing protein [Pseudomonadota bacterium]